MLPVWCQNGGTNTKSQSRWSLLMTGVNDASVAKMSGGDVDVEPYLDSQNTKGDGATTQILKPQSSNCVRVGIG